MNDAYKFFHAAALPEASLEDLAGQIAPLKGKFHLPILSFARVHLLLLPNSYHPGSQLRRKSWPSSTTTHWQPSGATPLN
jgi:hypothetical protein